MDIWYVDRRSLWLDLKILSLTVFRLLRPQGINRSGYATMPEFIGAAENENAQTSSELRDHSHTCLSNREAT